MGILGALAIIAGGVLSTWLTNRSNQELSHEQMNWNEYMQDKQNAYNDPAKQMERLQNAGINPVSMTMNNGQMQLGNTSAQANPYQLLPMSDPLSVLSNSLSSLGSGFNAFQSGKDLSTTREARVKQIELQNNQTQQTIRNLGLTGDAQYIANQYANQRELWALAGQKANVEMSYRQIKIFDKQLEQMIYTLENIWPAEVQKMLAEKDVLVLDLDRVAATTANLEANTAWTKEQQNLTKATTALTEAETKTEAQRPEQVMAETALTDQKTTEARALLDKYLSKYDAEIEDLAQRANLTKEQAYWFVFDEIDKNSIHALGSKIPANRFGPRKIRKRFTKAVESKWPQ